MGLAYPRYWAIAGELPENRAITPNRATPNKYIGFLPIISDKRPIGNNNALMVKDSAKTTH